MKDVGFLGELWQQVRLVFYLLKDREVPIYMKVLPAIGILYILFPIDIIADVIPVLGQLDDLTVLLIGAKVFIEMAPPQVVARHMERMQAERQSTIVEGTASDVTAPMTRLIEGEVVDDAKSAPPSDVVDPVKKGRWFRRGG